ncbi:MAG: ROK family transcriptional regulator [Calditrichia bacterium]
MSKGKVADKSQARVKANEGPGTQRARPLADSVLRLIWWEHQISRAEIARRMGLSRSTVTEIVRELLLTDLIAEEGSGLSRGGRRPIVLEFQDDARCILGVDIGATHVAVALTDLRGRLLLWKEEKHPVRTDPEGTRELVFKLCDACLEEWGSGRERLWSIGVAVPSPVDPLHPEWLSEVVIPAWRGRSEIKLLSQRYDVAVDIDNDANLGGLAEHMWGAGSGIDDLIYIKLGYGIGAGYILEGQIYRGANGMAGEIGHLPIDPNGIQCVCGLRGCLVNFVGGRAIEKRAVELSVDYPGSILTFDKPTYATIVQAAIKGDKLALQIVKEVAEYLGIAIAGWINIMNPQKVVLGGVMTSLGDLLLDPIREIIRGRTLINSTASTEICFGELGSHAVAIGAATLSLEARFSEPNFFKQTTSSTSK